MSLLHSLQSKMQLVLVVVGVFGVVSALHPDVGLNVLELAEKHGHPIQRHRNIVTEDGYVLELHRMPGNDTRKAPVLLVHGLSCSSADWMNSGPENGLAYLLHNAGYDVWLFNARGNTWSRKHMTFDPDVDREAFWKFTWHEIGYYDIPACVDYILSATDSKDLNLVGFSQGTTSFLVMASERTEYNSKVRLAQLLAPVAYLEHSESPIARLLSRLYELLYKVAEKLKVFEFLSYSKLYEVFGRTVCNEESPLSDLCVSLVFLITGVDSEQFNRTMFPLILSTTPAGGSVFQYLHFLQNVKLGKFTKFSYSHAEALDQVLEYDLTKADAPIALYYGKNDWLTSTKDVRKLKAQLPNVVLDNELPSERFNHIDFIWATDVKELLYDDVIRLLDKFQ